PDVFLMDLQDVAMSKNPVTMDINLTDKPKYSLTFSPDTAPQGPTANLKFMELSENPHITTSVDKVHSDTDLKSKDAMLYLYRKGADIHKISNILSVGALGIGANRKLVPTRWAITAADTQISQEFIDNVRAYNIISDFRVFHSMYLDNDFYVLLLPMTWSFEQIEVWNPGSIWQQGSEPVVAVDSELARNRKGYASEVTGAYYAARLAVAEYLDIEKTQAGAVVFREIGKEYMVPLGVWQIRENIRHAMKQKPMIFETLETAMKYISSKSRINTEIYNKHSKLLPFYRKQKRLFEFF
ncbi:MAG: hypothetical protein JXA43_00335, partial [Candidatus Diapherotrites archaeon]|nr:hypothetical protein [Candidatus Diapherotrites archaeon]